MLQWGSGASLAGYECKIGQAFLSFANSCPFVELKPVRLELSTCSSSIEHVPSSTRFSDVRRLAHLPSSVSWHLINQTLTFSLKSLIAFA